MRRDDEALGRLAFALAPELRDRLNQLLDATSEVQQVIELQDRAQRAEDLAAEATRQLRALQRAYDRLVRGARALRQGDSRQR